MRKTFVLLICMNLWYGFSLGQNGHILKGWVVDENNQTLIGASVYLYPVNEGTVTDNGGQFIIPNLPDGMYTIEISYVGYHTFIDSITISGDRSYHAQLNAKALSLQEVVAWIYIHTGQHSMKTT